MDEELTNGHLQELRRGTVVVACLAMLRTPHYGYQLLEELDKADIRVEGNTLYPLLRRLETHGLLVSEWNTDEARPRKFYSATPEGEDMLDALLAEWRSLDHAIRTIVRSEP